MNIKRINLYFKKKRTLSQKIKQHLKKEGKNKKINMSRVYN